MTDDLGVRTIHRDDSWQVEISDSRGQPGMIIGATDGDRLAGHCDDNKHVILARQLRLACHEMRSLNISKTRPESRPAGTVAPAA